MESVEVWMWLVAGIILGSIIFVSAFVFLSHYTRSVEFSQAQDTFNSLKTVIDKSCLGGKYSQERNTYYFPTLVQSVYIEDSQHVKGNGSVLCMDIAKQNPQCSAIASCTVTMSTIRLSEQSNAFSFLQLIGGSSEPNAVSLTVTKIGKESLNVSWVRTMAR